MSQVFVILSLAGENGSQNFWVWHIVTLECCKPLSHYVLIRVIFVLPEHLICNLTSIDFLTGHSLSKLFLVVA